MLWGEVFAGILIGAALAGLCVAAKRAREGRQT